METIFFERQEGMLCAQHALNMLLQQPYFTAVDLATIAKRLDELEIAVMSESALANFQSLNYDDSGYFSIQVITEALKTFDLHVVPLDNPACSEFRIFPERATAYICNLRLHWFIIRKFGNQWFHLNSLRDGPEIISGAALKMFFDDIIRQGYSVFLIEGTLPECLAHGVISRTPVPYKGILGAPTVINPDEEDEELAMALSLSEAEHKRSLEGKPIVTDMEVEDDQFQKVLQESLKEVSLLTDDDVNKAIQQSLNEIPSTSTASISRSIPRLTSSYSIEERRNAIEPDQAEVIRQQRSRFLDKIESQPSGPSNQ